MSDPTTDPTDSFVTCIHQVRLNQDIFCNITVTWAKTLISHSLYITVESFENDERAGMEGEDISQYTCKIDLKTWQFWGKKGLKTLRVADRRFDVFWDLRAARFSTSPEPESGFYVAMVSTGEMVLLLGDQREEARRRTKSRPCEDDELTLVHKKEIVYAKKCFCTKTTLDREHSVMIESALAGPGEPEMWIFVEGCESIRVPNLHWRFRGNEMLIVDGITVQVLWDVHDWLYSGSNCSVGIFVLRRCEEGSRLGDGDGLEEEHGFCHFIYACRT